MSANLTPKEARKASDEMLTQWANMYRIDSGVHRVVMNEINRRAEIGRNWRRVGISAIVILLGLVSWWLKKYT